MKRLAYDAEHFVPIATPSSWRQCFPLKVKLLRVSMSHKNATMTEVTLLPAFC